MVDKNKKVVTSVSKIVSIITIISLVSKFLGMLREVGVASLFGVGTETDAFYVAVLIPTLIFTSVGVALQNLFMAEFTNFKEVNQDKFTQSIFISKMVNILLLIAFILFCLSFLFTSTVVKIVAPGFKDPDKFILTVNLTRILLPTLVIIPIYQIKASVLRVYDRFITVAIIDLIFNISQLIYIFVFAKQFGIEGLAVSILLAYGLQLLIVEIIMFHMGFKNKVIIDFKDRLINNVFRLFLPTMISFGIIQINALVDKIIASNLDDGSVSALNYGYMVRSLVYNIMTLSIITVIYPKLLSYLSKNDKKQFNEIAVKTIIFFTLILLPITLIMLIFDEPIIKLIFERGNFTHEDTLLTSKVLFYYAIGIAAFSIKEFFIRICYAYKNTRLPLYITISGTAFSILFSVILKEFIGVNGIALGLSLSEILSLLIFIYFIKKAKYISYENNIADLIKIIIVNITSIIIILIVKSFIYLPNSTFNLVLALVIYVSVYFLIYLFLCYLLKIKMVNEILLSVSKRRDIRNDSK